MTSKLTRRARVIVVDGAQAGEFGTIVEIPSRSNPFYNVALDKWGRFAPLAPYRLNELERVDAKVHPAPTAEQFAISSAQSSNAILYY